ncbi:hypothetical protein JK359_36685 [Streptomyces actinomycinicus]|uniref:Uncharacterized protein n=1 Tax=Streptomyces actinomycinicus TaxID=1695166 RepID=A0A937ERT7_9ACTN|nr:hypothetical protein [Streptomyces actinomycinicus]MBL1087428.1 hypothetical protein [Streptomyces actinomycinicus]
MPVDDNDPNDAFEVRFTEALHQAGSGFEPPRQDLAARGEARGRRRAFRRQAAVLGGVTTVALIGVGGALMLPGGQAVGSHSSSTGASSPSVPPATSAATTSVSGDALVHTLEKLLPKGEFSDEEARGTGDPLPPFAKVVYDDGNGKAAVAVSFSRLRPGGQEARQTTECPDKVFIAFDTCRTTTLDDGSKLMILKGYEYPNSRSGTKLWTAEYVSRTGQHVSVQEWNAAAEKDAPVTRALPPLTAEQLSQLATARQWRTALDAVLVPPAAADPSPARGVPGGSVSSTLVSLLPKGVRVVSKSSADAGFGYAVLDDGKGASLVQVNVQGDQSDVENELFGAGTKTLPNGMKVVTHQRPGEKGGEGVVWWTVDTIRPDGYRVVISAFNSGAQNTAATRSTPALTMQQLETIATNAKWYARH